MPAMLTPGLTPKQQQHVADIVRRVGTVPVGDITSVFIDADRAGTRTMNVVRPSGETAPNVAQRIAYEHGVSSEAAAFVFGLAIGIRAGHRWGFAVRLAKRKVMIHDLYAKLTENQRREVGRLVRRLHREGPKPPKTEISDAAAARKWVREAGKLARHRG